MRAVALSTLVLILGTGAVVSLPVGEPVREAAQERLDELLEPRPGPYRSARVDDAADVLGPLAEAVDRLARAFRTDLGIDCAVATVRAPGADLAELALARLEAGASGTTTGALLVLIDAGGRRARIEASHDLEGALPDAVLARIARDQLAPYAAHGAVGMAAMDALHMLRDYALDQAARGALPLPEELADRARSRSAGALAGGAGAWARLAALPADRDLAARIPAPDRRRYAPSADPWKSIEALQRAWKDLAGDPSLELFTPGSRVQRRLYPTAPYELWKRLHALQQSLPLRLTSEGDRAVAWSERPARGFVPVLMRRDEGLWRIDLVETWKGLFFDGDGSYVLHNTSSPYAFALRHLEQGRPWGLAALPLDRPLDVALAELEARDGPRARLELAELLLRNCFATVAALARYEEASRLAPEDAEIARVYGERALYLGLTKLAIRELRRAGPAVWHRLAYAYAAAGEREKAARYYRRALRRNPDSAVAREGLARLERGR